MVEARIARRAPAVPRFGLTMKPTWKGGRPSVGAYDPSGMLHPRDIAIDGKGKLWVAESIEAPKRVSVWNGQTLSQDE